MKHVAVIGAGIAGLTAASGLQAAGHAVTLFEKSRGAGGRCATRRSAAGAFDHGASGFTATTAAFLAEVRRWQDAGWVAIDDERSSIARADDPRRAFGVPSMNALAQQLAGHLPTGVTLRADTTVSALEFAEAMGTAGGWRLRLAEGRLDETRFDAVAVAVPAEQAAGLLTPDATLAEAMRQTRSDPCWTVMAAWSARLPELPSDQRGSDPVGVLSLARCDDARPGRSEVDGIGCRWVLHATPAWTVDHLDARPADVIAELLGAFGRQCGVDLGAPVHSEAHRWRYARVPSPRAEPFGWNAALRLGACGDAWHGGNASPALRTDGIERAWLSGRALATQMALD
jgi:predicted NAD/FAD-dependent oxidoreductase